MKKKLIYIFTISCVFLTCLSIGRIDISKDRRYHQHLKEDIADLPVIDIDTKGQKIPGTPLSLDNQGYELSEDGNETIIASIKIKGQNKLRLQTTIRYRGNTSRYFDKKSYALHLIDQKGDENAKKLLGMGSHDEWVLHGPFLDRTMLRNYVCFNVSGEIMDYAPNVRYCELYVNGAYQGLYLLMETITRGNSRLNISKPDKNQRTTSFVVHFERETKGKNMIDHFSQYTYKTDISQLDVRYPGQSLLTSQRKTYIQDEISQVEKILYSMDLWDDQHGYHQYLDLYEFARYFIINEFFRNVDAGHYSTYFYRDVRGKIKPCVWDFNNACNNYIADVWSEYGFSMQDAPWFSQLLKDEKFVSIVIHEYQKLRKSYLSEDYLIQYITQVDSWLEPVIKRNDQVWGYVYDVSNYDPFTYLTPIERNPHSHQEAIEDLKEFIEKRGQWLDKHIESLYQYSATSKNASEMIR